MRRNAVEWLVLGTSIAGILVLVAILVLQGVAETQPADPLVELHPADARQGALGWIIPATVSNGGDEAVQAVVLEASATVDGAEEISEVEVDFLPAGTDVEVAFSFSGPPETEVTVQLLSYREP